MSEDPKPANGNLPPKLTLHKEESAALPIPLPASAAGTPPPSKKATARIPLTAVEGVGAANTPAGDHSTKTIRLTPLAASRPLSVTPAVRPPSATASLSDLAKRQTSRIPLEAAMATDQTHPAGEASPLMDAPKTIRIKRPGHSTTPSLVAVKVAAPVPGSAPAASPDVPTQKNKTSRVDVTQAQAEDAAQATQRKTIKIRRADGTTAKPVPRSMTVARIEAEAAASALEDLVRINVAFPIMAAVALIILGLLVVILTAQAFPGLGWNLPGTVTL